MLLIVCIGVMNTFWIAIRERTREVGTMRAMGMRRRSVLAMFVVEGVLLELFSTAVGIAVALLVGFVINHLKLPLPGGAEVILMSDRLSLQFVASSLVSTLVVMTLCVTFVSLFPAAVASRLRPVVAMSW
jgi:ABC-type antimicrobial peptide transport system permease subunit